MEGLSLAVQVVDTVLQARGTEAMEGPVVMEAVTEVMGLLE